MENNNYFDVKLVLLEYSVDKVKDIIIGSLALVRKSNEIFFVTEEVIKIEEQLEKASGTFTLKDGGDIELLDMYLVSDEDLEQGDVFIDTKRRIISTYNKTIIGGLNNIELVECKYGGLYPKTDCQKLYATTDQVSSAMIQRVATSNGFNINGDYDERIIEYPISVNEIKEIIGGEDTSLIVDNKGVPILKENKITICL